MSKVILFLVLFGSVPALVGCPGGDDDDDSADGMCADAGPCEGNYVIENADDLDAIHLCESIDGSLTITEQDWLTSIALPCLTSVQGEMNIWWNDELTSIAMPVLAVVDGDMSIADSDSLAHVDLSALATVEGLLNVAQLPSLTSLDGLPNITTVGDSFIISLNASLSSLAGVSSLANVGGNVGIDRNDCLSQAEAEAFATALGKSTESVYENGANYPCN